MRRRKRESQLYNTMLQDSVSISHGPAVCFKALYNSTLTASLSLTDGKMPARFNSSYGFFVTPRRSFATFFLFYKEMNCLKVFAHLQVWTLPR